MEAFALITHLHLIIACIVLQFVDFATTYYALSRPGAREGNKVMAVLFDKIGMLPTLVITKLGFGVILWFYGPQAPIAVLYIVTAVYLAVAVNNVRVIMAVRDRRKAAQ